MQTLSKPNITLTTPRSSKSYSKNEALAQALLILTKNEKFDLLPNIHKQIKNLTQKKSDASLSSIGNTQIDIEDTLASLRTSVLSDEDQKNFGAVFTPKWLADKVTQTAWQHWNKLHRTGRKVQRVGDISCGTGVFLSSARDFFGSDVSLYGNDTDETSLIFAKILNETLGLDAKIEHKDSLLALQKNSLFSSESENEKFDILIGNPPYIRSQNLPKNYTESIKEKYPDITSGNFDLSIIFIEHAIRSLTEGGICCYVTTSKFMHSEYGKAMCSRLAKDVRILNIIDFKDSQVFPDHTTYTTVITFTKLPAAKKFTVTHFPTGIVSAGDLNKSQTFSLNTNILEKFPWNLATDEAQSIIQKLNDPSLPLIGHIFPNILQGLRTGQNDIFVLKKEIGSNLEESFLRPFVGGEEIKRLVISREKYKLIYPYEVSSSGKVSVVEEGVLKTSAPNTYAYLLSNKQSLSDRDLDKNSSWYAFSRVQNLHLPHTPKILVKEMMPSSQFAADTIGDVAIGSGYAFVNRSMSEADLKFWSAVLSTPVMEFILRHSGTQLHSGWFRLLKHHLQSIRLPKFDEKQNILARKIVNELYKNPEHQKSWGLLDNAVALAFKLSPVEHQFIKDHIINCHKRSLPSKNNSKEEKSERANENSELLQKFVPINIKKYQNLQEDKPELRRSVTFQINKKLPVHRWFPFTQGYSEPLVDFLIEYFGAEENSNATILDPFVGSGTTILTSKKRGINTISFDISPLMIWVSKIKVSSLDIKNFKKVNDFLSKLKVEKKSLKTEDVFPEFLSKAFSSQIWEQVKLIKNEISNSKLSQQEKDLLVLGLVGILEDISQIRKHGSHYRYMLNPDSIGLQKLNIKILNPESDILPIFKKQINKMIEDIEITTKVSKKNNSQHQILLGDAKTFKLEKNSIDFVITSPPYLNRNNYIAQQKAELSLLSLVKNQVEYKKLVRSTFRSHTDSDLDLNISEALPEVQKIISAMELTDGNNSKIPQMIAGYFFDLEQNLVNLFNVMRRGGRAAFVVGNSRWGGVVVPVDHLLLLLAEKQGFKAEKIFVTRMKGNSPQQMKQFGKIPVRESVVIFKKP